MTTEFSEAVRREAIWQILDDCFTVKIRGLRGTSSGLSNREFRNSDRIYQRSQSYRVCGVCTGGLLTGGKRGPEGPSCVLDSKHCRTGDDGRGGLRRARQTGMLPKCIIRRRRPGR